MITKTPTSKPLSATAKANLAKIKALADQQAAEAETKEEREARHARAGVKVYTEAEKAAFLASRQDLLG